MSLTAAASTIFRMTNLRIALSLGQALEQLVHLMYLTWPRPCLARPLFFLFLVILIQCYMNPTTEDWKSTLLRLDADTVSNELAY